MSELIVDSVTTKSLSIVDATGKAVASLQATCGGAGLWITGPGGENIAVYSIKGQTAIGIYDKVDGNTHFMPLALTVNGGVPMVQFRDKDGEVAFVTLDEVKKAVDALKA